MGSSAFVIFELSDIKLGTLAQLDKGIATMYKKLTCDVQSPGFSTQHLLHIIFRLPIADHASSEKSA